MAKFSLDGHVGNVDVVPINVKYLQLGVTDEFKEAADWVVGITSLSCPKDQVVDMSFYEDMPENCRTKIGIPTFEVPITVPELWVQLLSPNFGLVILLKRGDLKHGN